MPDTKSKKEQLLERFDIARKQNEDLLLEIDQYAKENNSYDLHFMQDLTFKGGIEALKEERDVVFNDQHRLTILNADENSHELDFLIKKIEDQINHYGEIRMGLNVYFKSLN